MEAIAVKVAPRISLSESASTAATIAPVTTTTITSSRTSITNSVPKVAHQRPFTSRNDRPSDCAGPIPSNSSAGMATAKHTYSQMPGRIRAMKAGISTSVIRSVAAMTTHRRRSPNLSDSCQVVD
jgi:hypothetical protein